MIHIYVDEHRHIIHIYRNYTYILYIDDDDDESALNYNFCGRY